MPKPATYIVNKLRLLGLDLFRRPGLAVRGQKKRGILLEKAVVKLLEVLLYLPFHSCDGARKDHFHIPFMAGIVLFPTAPWIGP